MLFLAENRMSFMCTWKIEECENQDFFLMIIFCFLVGSLKSKTFLGSIRPKFENISSKKLAYIFNSWPTHHTEISKLFQFCGMAVRIET